MRSGPKASSSPTRPMSKPPRINLGYTSIVSPVDGPRRPAPGRYRQYRAGGPDQRHRGGDAAAADVGAVHAAGRQYRRRSWTACTRGATLAVDAYDRSQTIKLASGTLATVDNADRSRPPARSSCAPCSTIPTASCSPTSSSMSACWSTRCTTRPWCRSPRSSAAPTAPLSLSCTPDKTVSHAHRQARACRTATRSRSLKGLKPGDTVVVDGADRLRDGAEVDDSQAGTARSPRRPAPPAMPRRAANDRAARRRPR